MRILAALSVTSILVIFFGGSTWGRDTLSVDNVSNGSVWVARCYEPPKADGTICTGMRRVRPNEQYREAVDGDRKIYVRLFRSDSDRWLSPDWLPDRRRFPIDPSPWYRVETTSGQNVYRYRNTIFTGENRRGWGDVPEGWEFVTHYRASSGYTGIEIRPLN